MSADRDRGIRRQKQKRAKDRKRDTRLSKPVNGGEKPAAKADAPAAA